MRHEKAVCRLPDKSLADVLIRILQAPSVPYLRLFWHEYSGAIAEERFRIEPGDDVTWDKLDETLGDLAENYILTVRSQSVKERCRDYATML